MEDSIRQISHTSRQILEATATAEKCLSGPAASSYQVPVLSFPPAKCIRTLLQDGETSPIFLDKLSVLYHNAVQKLQLKLRAIFTNMWTKIATTPRHPHMLPLEKLGPELVKAYETHYTRKHELWVKELLLSLSRAPPAKQHGQSNGPPVNCRKAFNHQFVPVLETYFVENSAPSRAQKMLLAKQSGMSFRQIHIWFQNRRSRMNRTRCSRDSRSETVSTSVERSRGELNMQTSPRLSMSSPFNQIDAQRVRRLSDYDLDDFYYEPRNYAFPTPYPPQCSEDPFPCRYGNTAYFKEMPQWRKGAESRLPKNDACDISSLTTAFEKLSIHDNSFEFKASHSADSFAFAGHHNVMSPYTIRPLRAPLDSLLRRDWTRPTLSKLPRPPSNLLKISDKAQVEAPSRQDPLLGPAPQSENTLPQSETIPAASLYSLPANSDDSLPSLSYSSSSSVTSDDNCSQGSPVLSLYEQDFMSPVYLCFELPSILPVNATGDESLPPFSSIPS